MKCIMLAEGRTTGNKIVKGKLGFLLSLGGVKSHLFLSFLRIFFLFHIIARHPLLVLSYFGLQLECTRHRRKLYFLQLLFLCM